MKRKVVKKVKPVPVLLEMPLNAPQIQQPLQNEHQKKMDKISNDMAVLFEKKISASDLALWLAILNGSGKRGSETEEFTWTLGYTFLPDFIKCDTRIKKLAFLKEEIANAFSFLPCLREALAEIGIYFCSEYKTCTGCPESIEEFMRPYITFLALSEMYREFEFHKKEMEKTA